MASSGDSPAPTAATERLGSNRLPSTANAASTADAIAPPPDSEAVAKAEGVVSVAGAAPHTSSNDCSKGQRSRNACDVASKVARVAAASTEAEASPKPPPPCCQARSASSAKAAEAMATGSATLPMAAKTSLHAAMSATTFRSTACFARRRVVDIKFSSNCCNWPSFLPYSGNIRNASRTPFREANCSKAAGSLPEWTSWSQSRILRSHEPTSTSSDICGVLRSSASRRPSSTLPKRSRPRNACSRMRSKSRPVVGSCVTREFEDASMDSEVS
mmetsp:Transcript_160116/g.513721  ORF Transcript_160116/g.513721 Transcript_160116/m.513721 type:complete len:273 (+) Transcript_160116:1466-2284(+)